jgi:charged multivesicular body protein 5
MEDLIEQANEIQESLGRSYGVPDEVDEADLQAGTSTRLAGQQHELTTRA